VQASEKLKAPTEWTKRLLKSTLGDLRQNIDSALEKYLPPASQRPKKLHQAMRYSVFSGGKRLRPILALAACELCGGKRAEALPAACAVEFVHTYSLIHDDLPALDDDDLRRGKPSSHKAFGEATAILAGDALLTLAFEIICRGAPSDLAGALVLELARAAGSEGMIAGQALDMEPEGKENVDLLRYIHSHKTGSLIAAAVRMGAICARAPEKSLKRLSSYGENLGLAFQITDDLLDVEGKAAELGKPVRQDREHGKLTYPCVLGLERSRSEAEKLIAEAVAEVSSLGERSGFLQALARSILKRQY
jgi:geranylgeranyl diphosphate synthase type II